MFKLKNVIWKQSFQQDHHFKLRIVGRFFENGYT